MGDTRVLCPDKSGKNIYYTLLEVLAAYDDLTPEQKVEMGVIQLELVCEPGTLVPVRCCTARHALDI